MVLVALFNNTLVKLDLPVYPQYNVTVGEILDDR